MTGIGVRFGAAYQVPLLVTDSTEVDATGQALYTPNAILRPSATPVLTVAATYATGDYVGTSGVPMSFVAVRGKTGLLTSALLIDKNATGVAAELWLFDRSVTPPADSAAWTVSDADAQFLLGVVSFATYLASAANSVSQVHNINMALSANAAQTIYGCLVTRGSPTYTSLDLTVVLGVRAT